MKTKTFEVRDSATFIPVLAVKLDPENIAKDRYLLGRAGLGSSGSYTVLVHMLSPDQGTMDWYKWSSLRRDTRTMPIAHQFIEENFDRLETGAVIDVQFILGETNKPKGSEEDEQC